EMKEKALRQVQPESTDEVMTDVIVKIALEQIDEANPNWTYLASRLYAEQLYRQAAQNRGYDVTENKYGSFATLIDMLTKEGIYTPLLLQKYSTEEINYFESKMDPKRDQLFH